MCHSASRRSAQVTSPRALMSALAVAYMYLDIRLQSSGQSEGSNSACPKLGKSYVQKRFIRPLGCRVQPARFHAHAPRLQERKSDLKEDAIDSSQAIVRGSRRSRMGKRRKLMQHPHSHPHAHVRVTDERACLFSLWPYPAKTGSCWRSHVGSRRPGCRKLSKAAFDRF